MKIPFFPNTGDGTHCFQAAMRMALAVLMPEREFSYEELDRISAKLPGKWTWPTAAMLWMLDNGLEVELVENFDYPRFAKEGGDYLISRYGEEVGRAQIEHSDVEREKPFALEFARRGRVDKRSPDLDDIRSRLELGWVVIVNINVASLEGQQGYSGHFVVLCEIGDDEVLLHDPGLPPRPDLAVPINCFEAAWAYPEQRDRNLLAIRRPCHSS